VVIEGQMDFMSMKVFFMNKDHPMRRKLTHEPHVRPYFPVSSPHVITHLVFLTGTGTLCVNKDREHLKLLCEHYNVAQPVDNIMHFYQDFGSFRLKFERHSEFTTYTFYRYTEEKLFENNNDIFNIKNFPIFDVPSWWRTEIAGELLSFINLAIEENQRSLSDIEVVFKRNKVVGSHVMNEGASVYTDYRIHEDGSTRILLRNRFLREEDLGIVVQRILEIEQYRMMMLLGVPISKDITNSVLTINKELQTTAEKINEQDMKEYKDVFNNLTILLKKN